MAYAKHQSFYIRNKWISKGLKAIVEFKDGERFFFDEDAPEKIGMGKNMVESLRYWLGATGLIEDGKEGNKKIHKLTELGWFIYKNDRLLMKNDTISILHYNLVRNIDDQSTVFNWYFNIFEESVINKDNLLTSFITWVSKNEKKKISPNSLKRDIDCLIQFYTKLPNEYDPEDVIYSPFSKIKLMEEIPSEDGYSIIKKTSPDINDIGLTALYYTLLCYAKDNNVNLINVEEIVNEQNLWGKVFNLSRIKIIEALNQLTTHKYYPIQFVRTNNLDNIKIPSMNIFTFLESEYNLKGNR